MKIISDLNQVKDDIEESPLQTNIIRTDKDIVITTEFNHAVINELDPLLLLAWTSKEQIKEDAYSLASISRGDIIDACGIDHIMDNGSSYLPISILTQGWFINNGKTPPEKISDQHLAMETLSEFRGQQIMKTLLEIRENIRGVFKTNYSSNFFNIDFLLKNGYRLDAILKKNKQEKKMNNKMRNSYLKQIKEKLDRYRYISTLVDGRRGFNPIAVAKDKKAIMGFKEVLILRKDPK